MNSKHNNKSDERLDALLHDWHDQPLETERISKLHDQIVESAMSSAPSSDSADATVPVVRLAQPNRKSALQSNRGSSRANSRFLPQIAVAVSFAAVLLVGALLSSHSRHAIMSSSQSESPPAYSLLQSDQVRHHATLLKEMDTLFERPLVWLAESADAIDFKLDESDTKDGTSPAPDRLTVRLVVERRSSGSSAWQLAWTMDITSRNEEFVTVSPAETSQGELQLWTCQLPDGTIAVESSLQLAGEDAFAVTTVGIHHDTMPQEVVTAKHNEEEYRVFQSVAVLNETVI